MIKFVLTIYSCLIFSQYCNAEHLSFARHGGGLVGNGFHNVEKMVDIVKSPVRKVSDDLTGSKQKSRAGNEDDDWIWLQFEDYLDEYNKTVVDDKESPIKFLSTQPAKPRRRRSSDRGARRLDPLVPIALIPGTELYTGLFYKLGLKAFPRGFVVPSNDRTDSGYNKVEINLDPSDLLENFKKGGSKEFQNEWMFAPTEVEGWYTFIPRAYPNGMATYTAKDGTMGGLHVSVADRNEQIIKLLPGGIFREDAFWRPLDSGEKGFYKLQMKVRPNWNATWTNDKHGKYNHWMQIHEKDFGDDSKFTFTQGGIILDSKITSLTYRRSPQDVLKSNGNKRKSVLHNIDVSNSRTSASMEYVVSERQTKKSSWVFGLRENVEYLNSLSVEAQVGLPFIAEAKATSTVSISIGVEASQQYSTETEQSFGIDIKLIVPAKTSITGSVYYEWLENMELDFDAIMAVKGTAERLTSDETGKIIPGPVDPKFVEAYLKSNYENSQYVGKVDGQKGVFNVKVTGTLRGSMGSKTIVAIDGPEPEGFKIKEHV